MTVLDYFVCFKALRQIKTFLSVITVWGLRDNLSFEARLNSLLHNFQMEIEVKSWIYKSGAQWKSIYLSACLSVCLSTYLPMSFLAIMFTTEQYITQPPKSDLKKTWVLTLALVSHRPRVMKLFPWGSSAAQWSAKVELHHLVFRYSGKTPEYLCALTFVQGLHGELCFRKIGLHYCQVGERQRAGAMGISWRPRKINTQK